MCCQVHNSLRNCDHFRPSSAWLVFWKLSTDLFCIFGSKKDECFYLNFINFSWLSEQLAQASKYYKQGWKKTCLMPQFLIMNWCPWTLDRLFKTRIFLLSWRVCALLRAPDQGSFIINSGTVKHFSIVKIFQWNTNRTRNKSQFSYNLSNRGE